jgi:hypothetical protein
MNLVGSLILASSYNSEILDLTELREKSLSKFSTFCFLFKGWLRAVLDAI